MRFLRGFVTFILLMWTACFLVVVCVATGAFARDPGGRYAQQDPEKHRWFESLKSERGPCCSDADGALVQDADWESRDGHYRVRIEGEWVDVPDDAVIKEPNKDGRTIVWGYPQRWTGGGGYYIRCFMPGAMI